MAGKYDIESLLVDMLTFMRAQVNRQHAAIDPEKNDGSTLSTVANGAYFLQTASYDMTNFDPFVLYGIDDIEPGGGLGPATRHPYKLFVVVGLSDENNDPNLIPRLLRYQRALTEIFELNWASIAGSVKFKVSGLVPVPLALLDEKRPVRTTKIVGINLDVTLD